MNREFCFCGGIVAFSIATRLKSLRAKCARVLTWIRRNGNRAAASSVDATELALIFGEKQRGCAGCITTKSHISVFLNPSSEVGPVPLFIPASGHNLIFELIVNARSVVSLDEISAIVIARKPLCADGVSVQAQPGPSLVLSDDLAIAYQRSLARYSPLEIPHLEVLLDHEPPIVRPAIDTDGKNVRERVIFPIQVNGGGRVRLVLAPLTNNRELVDWELRVSVHCDGVQMTRVWDFKVTAETTFRSFVSDEQPPEFTPVQKLAANWYVKHPGDAAPNVNTGQIAIHAPLGPVSYL
jgi:hypothetical protein